MKKGQHVFYEWDAEEYFPNTSDTVEAGEIHDHNLYNKIDTPLDLVLSGTGNPLTQYRLVLTRYMETDADGVLEQHWAYVKDGRLPDVLLDPFGKRPKKVPAKYKKEFEAALKKRGVTSLPNPTLFPEDSVPEDDQ